MFVYNCLQLDTRSEIKKYILFIFQGKNSSLGSWEEGSANGPICHRRTRKNAGHSGGNGESPSPCPSTHAPLVYLSQLQGHGHRHWEAVLSPVSRELHQQYGVHAPLYFGWGSVELHPGTLEWPPGSTGRARARSWPETTLTHSIPAVCFVAAWPSRYWQEGRHTQLLCVEDKGYVPWPKEPLHWLQGEPPGCLNGTL